MLSITDGGSLARALNADINPRLKRLLVRRYEQVREQGLFQDAHFVVVQPTDSLPNIEAQLGFSPLQNVADGSRFGGADFTPGWEWAEDHGFVIEALFQFTDDGFAHVLWVPKEDGVSSVLLAMFEAFAEPVI